MGQRRRRRGRFQALGPGRRSLDLESGPEQGWPQHGGANNTMGEIVHARQDYPVALGHFLSAVALDPYAPSNTYDVAVTYERLGNTSGACRRRWRRYLALEMRDAAAREAATRHVTTLACGAG